MGDPNPPSILDGGSSSSSGTSISGTGQVVTGMVTEATATSAATTTPMTSTTGPGDEGTTTTTTDGSCGGAPQGVGCDLWEQCCPEGEKCMPWSDDGSGIWNSTRCTPIDFPPDPPGSDCMVEGNGTSGIDTCELGAMCFDVDPETNVGVCRALCQGDESNPVCDAGFVCGPLSTGDLTVYLCLPTCDPLLQDCDAGNACYPV